MSYLQVLRYLDSFINYEKKSAYPYKESLKLERISEFLKTLGDPQDSFRSVHVAGTKGKGSTCAFCAYILRKAGYRVGLYTSPHLSCVRERIRILEPKNKRSGDEFEGMISKRELRSLVCRLRPKIAAYGAYSKYGPLSFFEVYTALAFMYFKEKKVDFAVLETGLGGRLDATNVIRPSICAITSISYDHINKLGNTLREIAAEKAGIIKEGLIVVSSAQEKQAISVIRDKCRQKGASLWEIGKDISFRENGLKSGSQSFDINGRFEYDDLRIRLLGRHQVMNAVSAVALVEGLNRSSLTRVSRDSIRKGLAGTLWPARFELIPGERTVVLDAAHNKASAECLVKTLKDVFREKKFCFILGISKDKDVKGICSVIAPASEHIILSAARNPRALSPGRIKRHLPAFGPSKAISMSKGIRDAFMIAEKKSGVDSIIVVTGSIFLVAEARDILLKKSGYERRP